MKKLINLALRNICRNTRRSIITGAAITFGVFIMINSLSYVQGLYLGMVNTVVNKGTGHIQIHRQGYVDALENGTISTNLVISEQDLDKLIKDIKQQDKIKHVTERLTFSGLVSNGVDSTYVFGVGIAPEAETEFLKNIKILQGKDLEKNDALGYWLVKE